MNISIVIPAYNAADCIATCLESVLPGGREVIVVDDGSLDGTASIVRSFLESFPSLRLVSQENKGVSAARNRGLDESCGDYVVFVDADDRVSESAISLLEGTLVQNSPDLLIMRSFAGGEERYPWTSILREGRIYGTEDLMRAGYLRGSVCGCAFSRPFLRDNGLHFQEDLSHSEDVIFLAMVLSAGARIVFRNIRFYEVMVREDSASQRVDSLYFSRYRDALFSSSQRISDECVRVETSLRLILGITHAAIRSGLSAGDVCSICDLNSFLPVPGRALHPRSRRRLSLLNISYPLFYYGKKFSEKLKG